MLAVAGRLGPSWRVLGAILTQAYLEAILTNMEDKTKGRGWICEKPSKTQCFFFHCFWRSQVSILAHLGGPLGPSWGSWGDLGGLLGVLGPSWRRLGTSGSAWERLGASDHFWLCLRAGPGPETTRSGEGKLTRLGPTVNSN